MKKILTGVTGCLGFVATTFALIDALPQYNNIFLVLIGVTVGYALGAFTPDTMPKEEMSEKSKSILFITVMFLTPPFIILIGILVIWSIGFLTDVLIKNILGWGVVIMVLSYIVAGMVASYWAERSLSNNSTNNNSPHNKKSNGNT